ncbi:hypothetical protein J2Z19_004649 [Ensifer adhaerens]|uniref:Uncharacterized protein n=1 Tax=Ensifer adhaerens TaxID=106592 RepID=A0ACC5T1Y9_ENSAD|nr:hypothetical protein [Ensifer adhaerens]MBP1874916.1 hypothetical protein [Ensifer adhaerens]
MIDAIRTPLLIAISVAWFSFTSASSAFAEPSLDPTCSVINEAYRNTRSTPQYSQVLYEVRPDGQQLAFLEARFSGSVLYERYAGKGEKWSKPTTVDWRLADSNGPKFSACKLVTRPTKDVTWGSYYTAVWIGGWFKADAEIWLTGDGLRFQKLQRRFRGEGQFKFQVAMETFNYDAVQPGAPTDDQVDQSKTAFPH